MKKITTIVVPLIKGYWLMLQDSIEEADKRVEFYLKHECCRSWFQIDWMFVPFEKEHMTTIDLKNEKSVQEAIRLFRKNEIEYILTYHDMCAEIE